MLILQVQQTKQNKTKQIRIVIIKLLDANIGLRRKQEEERERGRLVPVAQT